DASRREAEAAEQTERQRIEQEEAAQRQKAQAEADASQQRLAAHAATLHRQSEAIRTLDALARQEFPELSNLTTLEQIQGAVAVMSPDRKQKFGQYVTAMQTAAEVAEFRQHQLAAEQAKQFDSFAKSEDAKFLAACPQAKDKAQFARLQKSAIAYLTEDLGYSEDELAHRWATDPVLRDHRTQILFADGARQRMAREARKDLNSKRAPTPPPQRSSAFVPSSAE